MAKFVEINSSLTIAVVAGMEALDATDYKSHAPDRLNAKAAWVDTRVLIKQGLYWYPAEIANYATVKSLNQNGKLTIGAFSDTCPNQEEVEAKRDELLKALEQYHIIEKKKTPKSSTEDNA